MMRRRRQRLLSKAYGHFISELADWNWFVTLTVRRVNPISVTVTPVSLMKRVEQFLCDLQEMAGVPIGWVIAEEFDFLGGRIHYHVLVCGVAGLSIPFWKKEAFRLFGRSSIEAFDPAGKAAFYIAKFVGTERGEVHFGGVLTGRDLSESVKPHSSPGASGKKKKGGR